MSGWICSYRKIWDHPVFAGNAQRVGAWHWMMHRAAISDTRFMADGHEIKIKRGQFCASQQQMCDATGMTRKQMRAFLLLLERESAVVLKRANDRAKGRTIVTICKYDEYQSKPESEGPSKGQRRAKEGPTKEQDNNLTREEGSYEPSLCAPTFDQFWAAWPMGKVSKQDAKRAFSKLSPDDRAAAMARLPAWAAEWRRAHPSASDMHPTTYLNRKRWQDELPANVTPFPSTGGNHVQPARQSREDAETDALRDKLAFAGRNRGSQKPSLL